MVEPIDRRQADDKTIGSQRPDRDADRPIDALLDRLWPPEPSAGLFDRLYAAGAATRAPRARATAFSSSRPWAIAAAAAAMVLGAAYLSIEDRGFVSTTGLAVVATGPGARVVVAWDGAATAVRLGAVHPADSAASDEGEPDDGGDDEDVALADMPVDEPDVPFI